MMNAAFQYAEEEDTVDEDLESAQLNFPVRLGFRAMEAKDSDAELRRRSDEVQR